MLVRIRRALRRRREKKQSRDGANGIESTQQQQQKQKQKQNKTTSSTNSTFPSQEAASKSQADNPVSNSSTQHHRNDQDQDEADRNIPPNPANYPLLEHPVPQLPSLEASPTAPPVHIDSRAISSTPSSSSISEPQEGQPRASPRPPGERQDQNEWHPGGDFDRVERHPDLYFDHTVHHQPAVTHETKKEHVHTTYETQRTRSFHLHEHHTVIQPIIDPNPKILPEEHWAQDHNTGEVFKIPDELGKRLDETYGRDASTRIVVNGRATADTTHPDAVGDVADEMGQLSIQRH